MTARRLPLTLTVLVAVVTGALAAAAHRGVTADKPATRATMRSLYATLKDVYVISLDAERFESTENRENILFSLRTLAANAERLDEHNDELDPSYDYLRRSLAEDARSAADHFDRGHYLGTRFLLEKMTESCFACHSRLPSKEEFTPGAEFMNDETIANLPPEDRMRLQVTTRQFDAALQTCEAMFQSMAPDQIAVMNLFEDYLKICIRVRLDYARAEETLGAFLERDGIPLYMREYVGVWIDVLAKLRLESAGDNELARARTLIKDAQDRNHFPTDRRGLASLMAASGLLHRYFESDRAKAKDLPEAYYLLGLAEAYTSGSYWLSETDFYLERAIRLDPKSPYALKAYEFLEQYTVLGYTGSSGRALPQDIQSRLLELRSLIGL